VRRFVIPAACALALLGAGCGDDDDDGGGSGSTGARQRGADLLVTVRPNGDEGPVRRRRIECERLGPRASEPACRGLAGLTAEQLAPVPAGTACTQIYGGPAIARVRGVLRGERVYARFELSDGCEIERWDRNRVLLDDAPAGG
jgi:hypothetical protein